MCIKITLNRNNEFRFLAICPESCFYKSSFELGLSTTYKPILVSEIESFSQSTLGKVQP